MFIPAFRADGNWYNLESLDQVLLFLDYSNTLLVCRFQNVLGSNIRFSFKVQGFVAQMFLSLAAVYAEPKFFTRARGKRCQQFDEKKALELGC